jgi:hypothetical protein
MIYRTFLHLVFLLKGFSFEKDFAIAWQRISTPKQQDFYNEFL